MPGFVLSPSLPCPNASIEIVTALSIDIMQIISIERKRCAVSGPPFMINNAFAFLIEKRTAEYKCAAFAALHAVSLSLFQLISHITFF